MSAVSRSRRDLLWVAAATLASWFAASALELQEHLNRRLQNFEAWQADELPFSLLVLACGLAWYALRRRRDVQAALALHVAAQGRVAELLARNRGLVQQLLALQESERKALARELHDELGQGCTALRIETAFLRHCRADDRAGQLAAADRADACAQHVYALVHDLLRRLRPPNLDTLGLAASLQELCESWSARAGLDCLFSTEGPMAPPLADAVETTVYRVAQEALTNVMRHAQAHRVQVRLSRLRAGEVRLQVEDDGRGIEPGLVGDGLGLLGASERAAAVGGELEVDRGAGAGVRLTLRIPLAAAT